MKEFELNDVVCFKCKHKTSYIVCLTEQYLNCEFCGNKQLVDSKYIEKNGKRFKN